MYWALWWHTPLLCLYFQSKFYSWQAPVYTKAPAFTILTCLVIHCTHSDTQNYLYFFSHSTWRREKASIKSHNLKKNTKWKRKHKNSWRYENDLWIYKTERLLNVLKIGAIALKMLQRYYSMSVPLVQTDEFLQLYYTGGKGPYTLIEYFSSFVYYSKLLLS